MYTQLELYLTSKRDLDKITTVCLSLQGLATIMFFFFVFNVHTLLYYLFRHLYKMAKGFLCFFPLALFKRFLFKYKNSIVAQAKKKKHIKKGV